jgi:hypothetical protein
MNKSSFAAVCFISMVGLLISLAVLLAWPGSIDAWL